MNCEICNNQIIGKLFQHGRPRRFCSMMCFGKSKVGCSQPWTQKRIKLSCKYCNGIFEERESLAGNRKYCSKLCGSAGNIGKKMKSRGGRVKMICQECSIVFFRWRYEADRKYCSKKCRDNERAKLSKGSLHWNWKGGISPRPLNTKEYKMWRKAVFDRDQYICQECGFYRGKILNAHHIKSWSDYPDLRYEVKNGITLCEPCHNKTDSFGVKKGSRNK